eukprot:TRINITY_DN34463_c0_g1_i1.p1 TRINITY_DN34463_c0_g1~~TRINITY_DN34463_c0_g1_i1.p1  ORF type:complete len:505 (-),score=129.60 TRINITY_DN34463_c0_g1_i1:55-1569(-)
MESVSSSGSLNEEDQLSSQVNEIALNGSDDEEAASPKNNEEDSFDELSKADWEVPSDLSELSPDELRNEIVKAQASISILRTAYQNLKLSSDQQIRDLRTLHKHSEHECNILKEQNYHLRHKDDKQGKELLEKIQKSGYLLKRGGKGHTFQNWRKRFFVLDGTLLAYYDSETAEESSRRGTIKLEGAYLTVDKAGGRDGILIHAGNSKEFFLTTPKDEKGQSIAHWGQPISAAIRLADSIAFENMSRLWPHLSTIRQVGWITVRIGKDKIGKKKWGVLSDRSLAIMAEPMTPAQCNLYLDKDSDRDLDFVREVHPVKGMSFEELNETFKDRKVQGIIVKSLRLKKNMILNFPSPHDYADWNRNLQDASLCSADIKPNSIAMSGWLWKKTRNWKRRWFVVTGSKAFYFEEEFDFGLLGDLTLVSLKGNVEFSGAQLSESKFEEKENCVKIKEASNRDILLAIPGEGTKSPAGDVHTVEEWRALFDRMLTATRDDSLLSFVNVDDD